jgi:dTDP-4-dehydrorhamnose 3,5-epimerase
LKFLSTDIIGAFVIELDLVRDDRGYFARIWCSEEFRAHNCVGNFSQMNLGVNTHKGTLRGLHYQIAPHEEAKLVRCTRGEVHDVIIDLRPASASYKRWIGINLSESDHRMLYVPHGCAQGYQTLTDAAEVSYLTSAAYEPHAVRGVRYDDATFEISWPERITSISEKDLGWPPFVG